MEKELKSKSKVEHTGRKEEIRRAKHLFKKSALGLSISKFSRQLSTLGSLLGDMETWEVKTVVC